MSYIKKDKDDMSLIQKDRDINQNLAKYIKNEHHKFVVLKTEKLASALYLVTGFVSETDPLRTRLRSCALELVSSSVGSGVTQSEAFRDTFGERCLEIGTMLRMAERAGMISAMNSSVLCDEYASLASFVDDHCDKICRDRLSAVGSLLTQLPKGHVERKVVSPVGRISKKTPNTKRHSDRRDLILNLLDKKDKISIKDAAAAIEGCSEKTVQRELLSMVEEGVLIKEGERRWSTYRRAS